MNIIFGIIAFIAITALFLLGAFFGGIIVIFLTIIALFLLGAFFGGIICGILLPLLVIVILLFK